MSVLRNWAVDLDMRGDCFGSLSQVFPRRLQRELSWDVSMVFHDNGRLQAGELDAARYCTSMFLVVGLSVLTHISTSADRLSLRHRSTRGDVGSAAGPQ
jgi:hypothetical protein